MSVCLPYSMYRKGLWVLLQVHLTSIHTICNFLLSFCFSFQCLPYSIYRKGLWVLLEVQFSFVILGPTGDHDCLFTTIKLLVVVVVLRQANQSRTKNQPTSRSEEDRWSHLVFLLGGTVVVRVLFLLSLSGQSLWTKQHTEAILVVRNLNQPNHYYPTHSSLPRS